MTSTLADTVAGYGISARLQLPDTPLDADEFARLLGECEHHRIVGLLGEAVRDGAFAVTSDQRDSIECLWRGWLGHAVRVERLLLDATSALAEHGIPSIALKGVALARTDYPDPSTRVFGDVDLLVEPHQFTRAANVLIDELGAERPLPELRRGFDSRFGKEILLRVRGLELDLHRMFVEGPYGVAIALDDLWREPEAFELGGRQVFALAPAARVVHAAYAAALGDWPLRLSSVRDFVETWRHHRERLEAGCELARSWRCDAVIGAAVEDARRVFGNDLATLRLPPPGDRRSVRDRLFLASYTGPGRGYLYNFLAPIAVRGLVNKARYLTAIAFPNHRYLNARGASRTGFLRQAWAKVRAGRMFG